MHLLYIHGFASYINPNNDKYATLAKLGKVTPIAPDYAAYGGLEQLVTATLEFMQQHKFDAMVGTSMGGYLASILHQETGLPFVALNPVVQPQQELKKYLGEGIDLRGQPYNLTLDILESYVDFMPSSMAAVFYNLGDELLDAAANIDFLQQRGIQVTSLAGGDHRFSNLAEIVPQLQKFLQIQKL